MSLLPMHIITIIVVLLLGLVVGLVVGYDMGKSSNKKQEELKFISSVSWAISEGYLIVNSNKITELLELPEVLESNSQD